MREIAYLILAHADPAHLGRLVNALGYRAHFFIHIDAKTQIDPFLSLKLPRNVVWLKKRFQVSWAGISMIDATLALIEAALVSNRNYSHLILISGADYPIKPARDIFDLLAANPKHEFIQYIDMRADCHYYRHLDRKWFREPLWRSASGYLRMVDRAARFGARQLRLPNRWHADVIPYFGSQWWALTPGCCRHILRYVADHANYREINRCTFSPDEHFIHTIVGNSPFADCSDGLQKFQERGVWRLANLHLIHESLSKWYTLDDWHDIQSSTKLFVRKVCSEKSLPLIEAIDSKILGTH